MVRSFHEVLAHIIIPIDTPDHLSDDNPDSGEPDAMKHRMVHRIITLACLVLILDH